MPSDGSAEARAAWALAAAAAVVLYVFRRPSENFTWAELTTTSQDTDNTPDLAQRLRLILLARQVLQPLRDQFGPIQITSAFRSKETNAKVKGASRSHHLTGNAADLYSSASNVEMASWLYRSDLPVCEVIVERHTGHLHLARCGSPDQERKFLQTADGKSYTSWAPSSGRIS